MIHYISLGQISNSYDTWEYKCPKFGKSNTDQSFYEPSSSRFQNAVRSGAVTEPSQDVSSIRETFEIPVKPNGITREELHCMYANEVDNVKADIDKRNNKSMSETVLGKMNDMLDSLNTTQETSIQVE